MVSEDPTETDDSSALDLSVPSILNSKGPDNFVMDLLVASQSQYLDGESFNILEELLESENGWVILIMSLVQHTPLEHSDGAFCMARTLRRSLLPTKEAISGLNKRLSIECSKDDGGYRNKYLRNAFVIIGYLADIFGEQQRLVLLSPDILNLLISQLKKDAQPGVTLYALYALERLAQSAENKNMIQKSLEMTNENPLIELEEWIESEDHEERQVGIYAQWLLDNIFLVGNRPFGYELVTDTNVTVILNIRDASPYLKMSPNGLEARNDVSSFEGIRSTFQIDSGSWYYEVLLITDGVLQIGWATRDTKFLNAASGYGSGVGDHNFSVGFDGCRKFLWHENRMEPISMSRWKVGDIVGAFIDLKAQEIIFYLNGEVMVTHTDVFKHAKTGFFAATSFEIFQHCQFNFGSRAFAFPPVGREFDNFNESAKLKTTTGNECKVILPIQFTLE